MTHHDDSLHAPADGPTAQATPAPLLLTHRPRPTPRPSPRQVLLRSPSHLLALGMGSGLAPFAPGTAGTLWAWLAYAVFAPLLPPWAVGALIAASAVAGVWMCARTAQDLAVADPSSIVWDEIVCFWAVLWLITPASLAWQAAAFLLFRLLDATKPGPIGALDRAFHGADLQREPLKVGLGIMLDDAAAALATLVVLAAVHGVWF